MKTRIKGSVCIRKFSEMTRIGDCADSFCEWVGIDPSEKSRVLNEDGNYMMVGDIPYDVWQCKIGGKFIYGKTLQEVLDAVNLYPKQTYNQFSMDV